MRRKSKKFLEIQLKEKLFSKRLLLQRRSSIREISEGTDLVLGLGQEGTDLVPGLLLVRLTELLDPPLDFLERGRLVEVEAAAAETPRPNNPRLIHQRRKNEFCIMPGTRIFSL